MLPAQIISPLTLRPALANFRFVGLSSSHPGARQIGRPIFFPRSRDLVSVAGFASAVGAYESVMGVFVLSEEAEAKRFGQRIGFDYLWRVLVGVRPFASGHV